MKFAVEAPVSLLLELEDMTSLDFALAHKVLEDSEYSEYFRNREYGRELILDNSMHELGAPLSTESLVQAAKLCRADYVITPDKLDDAEWSLQQYHEARGPIESARFKTAVNLLGETYEDRLRYLNGIQGCGLLCLPYRKPRLEWFRELSEPWAPLHGQAIPWPRIHLLGMSTFEELRQWRTIESKTPWIDWSVDTSKPVKAGLLWISLEQTYTDKENLRGLPISSKDLLDYKPSSRQGSLVKRNVRFFRDFLDGRV